MRAIVQIQKSVTHQKTPKLQNWDWYIRLRTFALLADIILCKSLNVIYIYIYTLYMAKSKRTVTSRRLLNIQLQLYSSSLFAVIISSSLLGILPMEFSECGCGVLCSFSRKSFQQSQKLMMGEEAWDSIIVSVHLRHVQWGRGQGFVEDTPTLRTPCLHGAGFAHKGIVMPT